MGTCLISRQERLQAQSIGIAPEGAPTGRSYKALQLIDEAAGQVFVGVNPAVTQERPADAEGLDGA